MTHECQDCGRDTKDLLRCDECGCWVCEASCWSSREGVCLRCRAITRECEICGNTSKSKLPACDCGNRYCEGCGSDGVCDACRDNRRNADHPDDLQWFCELPASFLYWLAKPGNDPVAIAECEIGGKSYRASASTIADAIHKLRADCGEVGEK